MRRPRPERRAPRRLAAALAATALFAPAALVCREHAPALGAAAQEWFPMVPGAVWEYEMRSALGSLVVEVTARGAMELPGGRGSVFVMDERNRGPDLGFVETAPVAYLVREGYVARISAVDYDAQGKLRLLGEEEPTWILPLDPRPGLAWKQETRLFQMPEGGGARFSWDGEVRPRTAIRVPAGSFADVAEVETRYRDLSEASVAPRVIYHDFYARGVGLVRSVTEDPSGDAANRVELLLRSYRFPASE